MEDSEVFSADYEHLILPNCTVSTSVKGGRLWIIRIHDGCTINETITPSSKVNQEIIVKTYEAKE